MSKSASRRPLAVVVGCIGKLPYAGMTAYVVHHILGLQDLGYDVHYVERLNRSGEAYDPRTSVSSDDTSYALQYLPQVLEVYGLGHRAFSFIDRENACHGSGWPRLKDVLSHADFVLTVADPTWFEELALCEQRIFIDGDPMFTQVAMATGEGSRSEPPRHYPTLFSYCTRFGMPDCKVPDVGRTWLPTRPLVATRDWTMAPGDRSLPLTALLHWAAGGELQWNGSTYGHKDREFEAFIDLPQHVEGTVVVAAGGRKAPRDLLRAKGWRLEDPLENTIDRAAYRKFVAESRADLGIAKHAYVATRSGWFSDRSTCFLAASRPVLHQETGFSEWLPSTPGVLPFSNLENLKEAIHRLDLDYEQHVAGAREVAVEHFEASKVLSGMLGTAGLR